MRTVDLVAEGDDPVLVSVSGGQKYKSTVPPVKVHRPQSVEVLTDTLSNLQSGVGPVSCEMVYGVSAVDIVVTVTWDVGEPSAYTGVIVVGVTWLLCHRPKPELAVLKLV